jgi:hypothetical protein
MGFGIGGKEESRMKTVFASATGRMAFHLMKWVNTGQEKWQ